MSKVFDIDVNEIIDNEFMTKDVSELVKGDYYLFHVEHDGDNCKAYLWKDGVLVYSNSDSSLLLREQYTKGTLQDFVANLGGVS